MHITQLLCCFSQKPMPAATYQWVLLHCTSSWRYTTEVQWSEVLCLKFLLYYTSQQLNFQQQMIRQLFYTVYDITKQRKKSNFMQPAFSSNRSVSQGTNKWCCVFPTATYYFLLFTCIVCTTTVTAGPSIFMIFLADLPLIYPNYVIWEKASPILML